MRIRWFMIVALGLVGLIWIGQGLGIIRGSGFMTDDIRWAIIGAVLHRVRHRPRDHRAPAPPEGLSQAAQAASARPAVISLPWRTSG